MVIQLIVSGIAMGLIYALVAIEYTLIWNSCKLLNFAHGQMITLGAYIFGGTFVLGMGASYALGWIGTIAIMTIIGVVLAFIVFIPLKDLGSLYAIVATLLFGTIITEVSNLIWGVYPMYLTGYMSGVLRFGGVIVTKAYAYSLIAAVAVVALLMCFMKFTKIGKAMRCVSENKSMSAMVGINVRANIIITIAISCVICAIIGMLIAPLFSISSTMANSISLKGFTAGVLGGFGSVPGALVGGIIVGLIENIATIYIDQVYKDIVSFVILILMLLIKPSGILGAPRVKMHANVPKANVK